MKRFSTASSRPSTGGRPSISSVPMRVRHEEQGGAGPSGGRSSSMSSTKGKGKSKSFGGQRTSSIGFGARTSSQSSKLSFLPTSG